MTTRAHGTWRFLLAVAAMLGGLLAALEPAAAAKYPPQLERELVAEIRSRRYRAANEAEETRRLAWPEWRAPEARCGSGGARAWDALVRDQVCAPVADDLKKIGWGLLAELRKTYSSSGPDLQAEIERLEGMSAFFDVPDASCRCLAKLFLHTLTDNPAIVRAADRQIEAVFNLKSLVEFVANLRTLTSQGVEALGENPFESQANAFDMVKAPGEAGGWFDSLRQGFESIDLTRRLGMDERLRAAAEKLAACQLSPAEAGYRAVLAESLAYVDEVRGYVVWTEEQVYCAAPAPVVGAPQTEASLPDAKELVRASGLEADLIEANRFYGEVLRRHLGISRDPRLTPARFAAQRERVKHLGDVASELQRRAATLEADAACGSGADAIRRLALELRDDCAGEGAARYGSAVNVSALLQRLDQIEAGRHAFEAALAAAIRSAERALAECRFGSAIAGFSAALAAFDQGQSASRLSTATYRRCFEPWAGERIEAELGSRGAAIAAAERAAEAALASARSLRDACDFPGARASLASATGHLAGTGCSLDATGVLCGVDPERCALARLAGLASNLGHDVDAAEAEVGAKLAARAAERQAAESSARALVEQAEAPASGRCAAIARARTELAGLRALAAGPAECPAATAPELAQRAAELEARLRAAEQLFTAELRALLAQAGTDLDRCDLAAYKRHRGELAGVPEVCDPEATTQLAALDRRAPAVEKARTDFAARLSAIEADWGAAYNACDVAALEAARNRILILDQHICATFGSQPEERTRLDALREQSEGLPAFVVKRAALRAKLEAKLTTASVRLRALETRAAAGGGTPPSAAELAEVESLLREVETARDPELPALCASDLADRARALRPELARAREGGAPPETSGGDGRSPIAPPPEAGWTTVGEVRTVGGGRPAGAPEDPSAGRGASPTPPAVDVAAAIAAATDAYDNCQMGAALGLARRVQALAPEHSWVAANLARIAAAQQAQSRATAALARARDLANGGDFRAAIGAANAAAREAPGCMWSAIGDAIVDAREGLERQQGERLQRNRQVFVQVMAGLADVWNRAASAGAGLPALPGTATETDATAARGASCWIGSLGGAGRFGYLIEHAGGGGHVNFYTLAVDDPAAAATVQGAVPGSLLHGPIDGGLAGAEAAARRHCPNPATR